MSNQYQCAFAEAVLERIPQNRDLQAWNSADIYLLNYLYEHVQSKSIDLNKAAILILNDDFGALTLPLAQYGCDTLSDSFISHQAIKANIVNNCPEAVNRVSFVKSTDPLNKTYDIVLFKTVKTLAYVQEQMRRISEHIHPQTIIVGAAMAKTISQSLLAALTKSIGPTEASLAWKKARLLHITPEAGHQAVRPDMNSYELPEQQMTLKSYSNVFSGNKLDIGSRFFLQNLPPASLNPTSVIDLGCGNGVLTLALAQQWPNACFHCIDESYMAVASAEYNVRANYDDHSRFYFYAANSLENFNHSVDLIVCNPPFHQQYVVGDTIAWKMFKQSRTLLNTGGELWIVGNRHLGYHAKLKRLFGNQTLVAGNKKFVVLKAVKRSR
jgi:16S rRNA G1207 methylase RsmC